MTSILTKSEYYISRICCALYHITVVECDISTEGEICQKKYTPRKNNIGYYLIVYSYLTASNDLVMIVVMRCELRHIGGEIVFVIFLRVY